jgi:hypothetical protein
MRLRHGVHARHSKEVKAQTPAAGMTGLRLRSVSIRTMRKNILAPRRNLGVDGSKSNTSFSLYVGIYEAKPKSEVRPKITANMHNIGPNRWVKQPSICNPDRRFLRICLVSAARMITTCSLKDSYAKENWLLRA